MKVPEGVKTLSMTNSVVWINDGIMFSVPSGNAREQTREEIMAEMKRLHEFLGHRKYCLVIESDSKGRPPAKEMRDFLADQLTSITTAMAIVTSSPLSKMLANLFFSFKPPQYPVKFFTDSEEAIEWAKQHLKG